MPTKGHFSVLIRSSSTWSIASMPEQFKCSSRPNLKVVTDSASSILSDGEFQIFTTHWVKYCKSLNPYPKCMSSCIYFWYGERFPAFYLSNIPHGLIYLMVLYTSWCSSLASSAPREANQNSPFSSHKLKTPSQAKS